MRSPVWTRGATRVLSTKGRTKGEGKRLLLLSLLSGLLFFQAPSLFASSRYVALLTPTGEERPSSLPEKTLLLGVVNEGLLVVGTPPRPNRSNVSGWNWDLLETYRARGAYYLILSPASLPRKGPSPRVVASFSDGVSLVWSPEGSLQGSLSPPVKLRRLFPKALQKTEGTPTPDTFDPDRKSDFLSGIVQEVSGENLKETVESLESFPTRYASTASCDQAADYLAERLRSYGLEVSFEEFTFGKLGYRGRNVVAFHRGRNLAEDTLLLTAHYDSTSGKPLERAPGADDNASGTAAILEAARVLSRHPYDISLRFVLFSAEEWGLYGSEHHAYEAYRRSERILGVLNFDMVGYVDRAPEDLDLIVDDSSLWLAERFSWAAALYTSLPLVTYKDSTLQWSDHAPFWDYGYSALCGIEDVEPSNPNYHEVGDLSGTLDFSFLTESVRALVAVAAEMAQPVSEPPPPLGLALESQIQRGLLLRKRSVRVSWRGEGAYRYRVYRRRAGGAQECLTPETLKGDSYTDRGLPTSLSLSYWVTAIDGQGRESNPSTLLTVRGQP